MRNLRQEGWALYVPAPSGGCKSGDFVVVGSIFGVAGYDAVAGQVVPLHNVGVYSLPKETAEAWTVGAPIYWNATDAKCTNQAAAGANMKIGVATALQPNYTAAAAAATTVGDVRLNPAFLF